MQFLILNRIMLGSFLKIFSKVKKFSTPCLNWLKKTKFDTNSKLQNGCQNFFIEKEEGSTSDGPEITKKLTSKNTAKKVYLGGIFCFPIGRVWNVFICNSSVANISGRFSMFKMVKSVIFAVLGQS